MTIVINGRVSQTAEEQMDHRDDGKYPRGPIRSKTEEKTLRILGTAEDMSIEELEAIQYAEMCD